MSRVYPALAQRQLGLSPAKTPPATPLKGESGYRQWMDGWIIITIITIIIIITITIIIMIIIIIIITIIKDHNLNH